MRLKYTWPIPKKKKKNRRTRRCDLVGYTVSLEVGLELLKALGSLSEWHHAACNDNGLNLWALRKPPIECSLVLVWPIYTLKKKKNPSLMLLKYSMTRDQSTWHVIALISWCFNSQREKTNFFSHFLGFLCVPWELALGFAWQMGNKFVFLLRGRILRASSLLLSLL